MRVLLSFLSVFFVSSNLFSQLYEPLYSVHLRASIGPTYSFGAAPQFSGVFLCSQYIPNVNSGYDITAGIERGFGEQIGNLVKRSQFSIAASFGFSKRNYSFDAVNSFPFWDSLTSSVSTLSIQSDYLVQIQSLDAALEVLYRLPAFLPKSQTKVVTGVSAIVPLTTSFQQTESILSPRNATFNDNGNPRRSLIVAEGNSIVPAPVFYRTHIGIVNSVLLSRNVELLQRLEFQLYSNPVQSSTIMWLPSTLQCSLGISYTLPNSYNPDTPLSPSNEKK